MKETAKYPLPDNFFSDTAKHCTAIFIYNSPIGVEPTENDLNATLTLIEFKGTIYGITCKHVSDKENRPIFATLTQGKRCVINNFIYPRHEIPIERPPDIAIRQIHPEFPQAIGKIPIRLEQNNLPDFNTIRHAVAVGYPTKEKRRVDVQNGYRIQMPCVHALAEISSINKVNGQLSLHSELEQIIQINDFSGMSGGPVFWSTEEKYGLLGIIYETLPPNPSANSLGEGPRVNIKAELVTLERFENWLIQFPALGESHDWLESIDLTVHVTPQF